MIKVDLIAKALSFIAGSILAFVLNKYWKLGLSTDDLAEFYAGFGVTKEAYLSTFQSFATDSMMRKGQRDVQIFGVTGTPTLVVNRQYRVGSNQAVSDFNAMLDVVNFLVARELAAE